MNGHTGGLGVRGRDRLGEDVVGPQRSQVAVRAEVAVDPVAHDLDPPVALARLAAHGLGELGDVVELEPVVAQVALGPGEVAARAHEARQVTTAVHPPRVERRAGVAHQENPLSRSVSACSCAVVASTAPWAPSPTWQCTSTRPGRAQPSSSTMLVPCADGRVRLIRPS